MQILAAIFDLDGTVLEDEVAYGEAFRKVLRSLGIVTSQKYPHKGGIGVEENWPYLIKKFKIKTTKSKQVLARETQNYFRSLLGQVKVKNGFFEFVKELKRLNIMTALATSNLWAMVEEIFDKFDLRDCFDAVVTGEEVSAKKPDSEIFIVTARKLGVEAKNCLVFEDSAAGVKAAKEAGMRVVGVGEGERSKTLAEADKVVADYTDFYKILDEDPGRV
ncbi:HAD family phosphatase [Candidatus Woesebacteria bacterium]|nr:HAD family phosphatase [Candidatus Woesebacteria bacterium]